MAIPGIQVIGVGLQNESIGSDSLYIAFNKTKDNFTTLFGNSSPFNTFTGNLGIGVTTNSLDGTVIVDNTGVVNIVPGTNITITPKDANGNVTISSTGGGGGGGGTVTSIGVASTTLVITNTPIVSAGNINVNLPVITNVVGTYTAPTITVDPYGRITSAISSVSSGTVTSIAVTGGTGIQTTGGPITTTGTINIINTGVTRVSAGTGIAVSGSTGNITISAITAGGTVTSVGLSSSSLIVTGGAITTTGTINVEGPIGFSSENLANLGAANLAVTASYFTITGVSTATLAAGTAGQVKTFMRAGVPGEFDMVITVTNAGWKSSGTGTATFGATTGTGCTLQYVNSKWFCIGNNGVVFA
jgi:hypothetical protein